MSKIKKYIEDESGKSVIILAITLVILVIFIGFTIPSSSVASYTVGETLNISLEDLESNKALYCIEKDAFVANNSNKYGPNKYTVKHHITISGKQAGTEDR